MNSEIKPERKNTPVVSRVTDRGLIIELVYRPADRRTLLAIGNEDGWRIQDSVMLPGGETLVPFSSNNNLIRNECVLFPSAPENFGSAMSLVREIDSYLSQYVTLSGPFRLIAPWYVLFSWVHDAFNELPYLRFRGDYGTGKTRALIALGGVCYKPFFASGASTPSPIFHTLNSFGGTLILDEADFRLSDERADIVKILNNGNVRGMPVLRTIVTKEREFNPQAFHVFGPKLVAMRKDYDDRALESRFLTEETAHVTAGEGIPINLPAAQREAALELRNKLLAYRFGNLRHMRIANDIDWTGDPRLRQSVIPLLSIIEDATEREAVRLAAIEAYVTPPNDYLDRIEIDLVTALVAWFETNPEKGVSCGELVRRLADAQAFDLERPINAKWVGSILRERLRLATYKSHGVYTVPPTEFSKIKAIAERHKRKSKSSGEH